jgi:hypothetical protein
MVGGGDEQAVAARTQLILFQRQHSNASSRNNPGAHTAAAKQRKLPTIRGMSVTKSECDGSSEWSQGTLNR